MLGKEAPTALTLTEKPGNDPPKKPTSCKILVRYFPLPGGMRPLGHFPFSPQNKKPNPILQPG